MKEKVAARHYKRKQIESATPGQLIVLLYDGAIDALNRAETALGEKGPDRFEKFHNLLIHAQNIITELSASLDMEKGGEIASNLLRLYDFMLHQLVRANMDKNAEALQEVKQLLNTLKEAWVEVAKKEPQATAPRLPAGLNMKG